MRHTSCSVPRILMTGREHRIGVTRKNGNVRALTSFKGLIRQAMLAGRAGLGAAALVLILMVVTGCASIERPLGVDTLPRTGELAVRRSVVLDFGTTTTQCSGACLR